MDLRMLLSVLGVGGTPWEPMQSQGAGKDGGSCGLCRGTGKPLRLF